MSLSKPLFTAVALAALGLSCSKAPAPPWRPNVVLVLIDTTRADRLSAYGHPRKTTPWLESLAAEGTLFESTYSSSSWTPPATASLLTSLYPIQHGVLGPTPDQVVTLGPRVTTLAESLKAAGYATFGISANPQISVASGFAQGFDRFESAYDLNAEAINKHVKKWAAELRSRQPYFLYLHYLDPHEPYEPNAPWFQQFHADTQDADNPKRHWMAAYDSEIRYVDSKLAGLDQHLDWRKDALVAVTADHGEEFLEHGRVGHAETLYDEVLHVPFVLRAADHVPAGLRVSARTSLLDVTPTLLGLLSLAPPPRAQGESLTPYLSGSRSPGSGSRTLFARVQPFGPEHEVWRGVRHGSFKYITRRLGEPVLFDLSKDPREEENVLSKNPEEVQRLSTLLESFDARAVRVERPSGIEMTPEMREKLKALGYLN